MSEPSSKPSLFPDEPVPYPADDVLPEYSSAATSSPRRSVAPCTEHRATLQHNGRTWLTLLLRSHIAHTGTQPYFFGAGPITGTVELDLAKPEGIQTITIQVFGRIIGRGMAMTNVNYADQSLTFFKALHVVWEAPPPAAGTSVGLLSRLRGQESEKLYTGAHVFDFSFDLPTHVRWESGKEYGLREFDMPATFVEQGARGSIFYEMKLKVKRSGTLNTDDFLCQPFSFCPAIRSGLLSEKRRTAYEAGEADVPGPSQDLEGWERVPPVAIRATIFGQREVEAQFTMFLAKPLCYTRGGIIPCELQIACQDVEALDLLSAPSAPVVKLLCHMQYTSIVKAKQANPSSVVSGVMNSSYYADMRALKPAVWWRPRGDVKLPSGERRLSGEIHVPPTLKPGMQTPEFDIYYTVALFPPVAPDVLLTEESARQGGSARMPLHATRIDIATLYPEGVRPLPVTPPSYEQPEPWPTLLAFTSALT